MKHLEQGKTVVMAYTLNINWFEKYFGWFHFNPFGELLGGARFTSLKFTNKDHSNNHQLILNLLTLVIAFFKDSSFRMSSGIKWETFGPTNRAGHKICIINNYLDKISCKSQIWTHQTQKHNSSRK